MICEPNFLLLDICLDRWEKEYRAGRLGDIDPVEIFETFWDTAQASGIYVYHKGKTLRVSKSVLDYTVSSTVSDLLNIETEEASAPFEFYSDWSRLPRLEGKLFYYVNPDLWTIDTSVYEFLRENIQVYYHPFLARYGELTTASPHENGDLTSNAPGDWDEHYENIKNLHPDYGDTLFPETYFDRDAPYLYDDIEELIFPRSFYDKDTPYAKIKNASLCLNEAEWEAAVQSFKQLASTPTNQALPTIAAERRAEREARVILADPGRHDLRQRALRELIDTKVSNRAWLRIIDRLREEYPQVSLKGRPKKT